MIKISMREFSHNLADYVKRAEKGEKIIVTKRNKPVVQITFANEHVTQPSWKDEFVPVEIKGMSASETLINERKNR